MRKDQREELRRLEEALLEPEEAEDWQEDSDLWLEQTYSAPGDFQVYNTDTTDVDLEEFSEAVRQTPPRRGCLGFVIAFLSVCLLLLAGYLLYMLEVI